MPIVIRIEDKDGPTVVRWSGPGNATCYACDGPAVGVAERWEGENPPNFSPACQRHAYRKLRLIDVCDTHNR